MARDETEDNAGGGAATDGGSAGAVGGWGAGSAVVAPPHPQASPSLDLFCAVPTDPRIEVHAVAASHGLAWSWTAYDLSGATAAAGAGGGAGGLEEDKIVARTLALVLSSSMESAQFKQGFDQARIETARLLAFPSEDLAALQRRIETETQNESR